MAAWASSSILTRELRFPTVQQLEQQRSTLHCCSLSLVLKKSPSWCLRGRQQQGYKQTRVSDAAGNRHSRRLAAYDGATRPFGVAVLLLPHRRSGSSKPLVTFHRPLRQLRFCA